MYGKDMEGHASSRDQKTFGRPLAGPSILDTFLGDPSQPTANPSLPHRSTDRLRPVCRWAVRARLSGPFAHWVV